MATLNKTLKKFRYEKRRQIIGFIKAAEKKGVTMTFLREKKKVYVGVSI